jgi:hypothetical protein
LSVVVCIAVVVVAVEGAGGWAPGGVLVKSARCDCFVCAVEGGSATFALPLLVRFLAIPPWLEK